MTLGTLSGLAEMRGLEEELEYIGKKLEINKGTDNLEKEIEKKP